MTPFAFEHVFRAPSVAAVFAAYFDAGHQAQQDQALGIARRTITELDDTPERLHRVCQVVPNRQLPGIVRPFVSGPLTYRETATWRRADHEIDLVIIPSLLSGSARIEGIYKLDQVGPAQIRRRYTGRVTVGIPLVGGRIERGIVAEFAASMPVAASTTQAWLDLGLTSHLNPENPSGIIIA